MLSKLTVTKILCGALVPSAPQEYPANPTLHSDCPALQKNPDTMLPRFRKLNGLYEKGTARQWESDEWASGDDELIVATVKRYRQRRRTVIAPWPNFSLALERRQDAKRSI
jgi:hypothetical protein